MILVKENGPAQVKLFKIAPSGPFILKTYSGGAEIYSIRKSSWKVIVGLYNSAVIAATAPSKRSFRHGK